MLKKIALVCMFVMFVCSKTIADSQSTGGQPTTSYSFEDLCKGKIHPTKALTLTLNYLKERSGETECAKLENWLSEQEEIPTGDYDGKCHIDDLRPLAFAKNLKSLDIGYVCSTNLTNISPLKNLVQLKVLRLSGNKIKDISPLKNLKNLEKLDIRTNPIADLSPIAGLVQLQELDIRNIKLNDISILFDLKNLKTLTMGNNRSYGPNLNLSAQQKKELIEKIPDLNIDD